MTDKECVKDSFLSYFIELTLALCELKSDVGKLTNVSNKQTKEERNTKISNLTTEVGKLSLSIVSLLMLAGIFKDGALDVSKKIVKEELVKLAKKEKE